MAGNAFFRLWMDFDAWVVRAKIYNGELSSKRGSLDNLRFGLVKLSFPI
jgi:hypothetical protein